MKFTDGNWLIKDGMKIHGAIEVVDFEVMDSSLTAPNDDIIRVSTYHFKSVKKNEPEFIMNDEKKHLWLKKKTKK
ncbi:MAG: hypothetical protein C0176_08045 [Mesoaciditoga sp.]|uniref:hypothetical protein n=1 Tax=Athalassotoga sp. TaxID=2022597 RepID=UPI000CC62EB0|nr:MAG: hypothetical protein C0176_08045 [Mesoaciditoga sp.]HEU23933.1 hypothetical protein [Mesoaciditoga lauensis]